MPALGENVGQIALGRVEEIFCEDAARATGGARASLAHGCKSATSREVQ